MFSVRTRKVLTVQCPTLLRQSINIWWINKLFTFPPPTPINVTACTLLCSLETLAFLPYQVTSILAVPFRNRDPTFLHKCLQFFLKFKKHDLLFPLLVLAHVTGNPCASPHSIPCLWLAYSGSPCWADSSAATSIIKSFPNSPFLSQTGLGK